MHMFDVSVYDKL